MFQIKANKKVWLVLGFFLITTYLLQAGHILKSDEGVVLNAAWNLYNGQKLYQDFFEYVAPASFYFVWLIFSIFSPSYLAVQIVSVIFLLLTVFLTYKIYLLLSSNKNIALATSFSWLVIASISYPLINHNTYSTFLVIFLTYFFLSFLDRQKRFLIFLSGIFSSLIFYFLQTKGILIILSLTLFIFYLLKFKKINLAGVFSYYLGLLLIFFLGLSFWGKMPFITPLEISRHYLKSSPAISYLPLLIFSFLTLIFYFYASFSGQTDQ